MKTPRKKFLGLALTLAVLFASVPLRAQSTYQISAWPDSIAMNTVVGTSTDAFVYVMDGRDTTLNLSKRTAHISLSGSSEFTLLDSVVQFVGWTEFRVRFSPTAAGSVSAQLIITGDGDTTAGSSNTAEISLVGYSFAYMPAGISGGNYDNLYPNEESCQMFGASNSNADTLWITQVNLTQAGSQWSLQNVASLPMPIPSKTSYNIGELCALIADSGECRLTVVYRYGSNVDSSSETIRGYTRPTQQLCMEPLKDSLKLDELIFGGYVDATASFIMHRDTTLLGITGEVLPIGGTVKILSPSLPMNVHSGDTVTFQFRVKPLGTIDSSGAHYYDYYGYYLFYLGDCSGEITFTGSETDSMNTNLQLFPGQTGLLALKSKTSTVIDTFWFDNNYSTAVRVSAVSLANGTNFHLLGILPHALEDTLSPGNKMGAIIQFDADTNGFYHDSLTITTDVMKTYKKHETTSAGSSQRFNLEAIRTQAAPAAVEQLSMPAAFTLSPNPARDAVTIGLPNDGTSNVEIYDVLGNLVFRGTEHGSFVWNGTANGSPGGNGAYIVRVSHGNRVSSQRLMLER